jgi:hypothetical protein
MTSLLTQPLSSKKNDTRQTDSPQMALPIQRSFQINFIFEHSLLVRPERQLVVLTYQTVF